MEILYASIRPLLKFSYLLYSIWDKLEAPGSSVATGGKVNKLNLAAVG